MLNDLTCKCLPPSGLARQVSDMKQATILREKASALMLILLQKQHMFTALKASYDFIANAYADGGFEEA